MAAAAAAPKAPSAAELVQEQAKKSASLRLQLMAQDQQIHKLLDETKPQQAATDLSSQAIEATLASAVSDMSTRLHATNPIKEAAQLGVADPVDYTESAAMGLRKSTVAGKAVAVTAALKAPAAPQTAAQAAAAKAAHLKKVLEIDGLLLKGKKQQVQLKSTPAKYPAKLKKARTQELADGSAQEQLASAEAKEESMQHHHQLAKALKNRGHIRQQKDAGDQVDHPTLDQEESNSFFGEGHVQNGVRLPDQKATKLKYAYRSQMHKLDQAAGDAETMKITGSIRDLIPESLFHALNRQNVIHDMNHPRTRVKGFPSRRDSDTVFGHSIDGGPAVPSDHDVIKENNRMLSGLELAAGYKSPKARKTSSAYSGDGWGQHHVRRNDDKGWNSKQWLGGAKVVQDEVRPLDDDSIPVLSDGWGQHDGDNEASVAATAAPQGLAGWKKQLKSSEQSLGMRGLMAKQMGMLSKHTQLQDAQRAASDGWLR